MKKVLLALVDGLRPDAVQQSCPALCRMAQEGQADFGAQTTFPPVTLPCHLSLFHSVGPERHGVFTNDWTPMVRPVPGLVEVLHAAGRSTALFYEWEPLRDIARPGSATFARYQALPWEHPAAMEREREQAQAAADYIRREQPDFVFFYLGYTDNAGHQFGWMGREYQEAAANADGCIRQLWQEFAGEYAFIATADHGGHLRTHGQDCPEDMQIPLIAWGEPFPAGRLPEGCSILDIAPTVAQLLEAPCPKEWEGRSLLPEKA